VALPTGPGQVPGGATGEEVKEPERSAQARVPCDSAQGKPSYGGQTCATEDPAHRATGWVLCKGALEFGEEQFR